MPLKSILRNIPSDTPLTEVMHAEDDHEVVPVASSESIDDPADIPVSTHSSQPAKQEFMAPFAEWDPSR